MKVTIVGPPKGTSNDGERVPLASCTTSNDPGSTSMSAHPHSNEKTSNGSPCAGMTVNVAPTSGTHVDVSTDWAPGPVPYEPLPMKTSSSPARPGSTQ